MALKFEKEQSRKLYIFMVLMMVMVTIFKCVFTIWGRNYLYADGSNYCYGVLDTGTFTHWVEGRQGSVYLMQLPICMALKFGINNITVLCALFGLGASIWYPVLNIGAMLLCYRKNRYGYIPWLAILYVLINIYSGFLHR